MQGPPQPIAKRRSWIPKMSSRWRDLAVVLSRQKKPQEALSTFKRIVAIDAKNWQAYNSMGLLLLRAKADF